MDVDPATALRHADRAVSKNPGVWPGHVQRVEALLRVGRNEDAETAQIAGLCIMGDSSVQKALKRWFPDEPALTRTTAIASLTLSRAKIRHLTEEINRLTAGPSNTVAFRRLFEALTPSQVQLFDECFQEVPEEAALSFISKLRRTGDVLLSASLLERYPDSPRVSAKRKAALQDAAAINRTLQLPQLTTLTYVADRESVLYLLHNSFPYASGGYANRSHGLLKALGDLGRRMTPVTRPGFPSQEGSVFQQRRDIAPIDRVDGLVYHRLLGEVRATPRVDLSDFLRLYAAKSEPLIVDYRPTLFHGVSNWWNGAAAVALGRAYDLPSVYEVRGLWEVTKASRDPGWVTTERYRAEVAYETFAANSADAVITITEGLKDELIRRGVAAERIHVVPNAVNLDRFQELPYDEELAAQLGITPDQIVIGFAGTLTHYEGLDLLLRAGAKVIARTEAPLRFLFVGDGPALGALKALAIEIGLASVTRFVGRVPPDEVARYLSLVDITPFPRLPLPVTEMVSPLKPLESMASRIAVIASDVRALTEMVPPGTGLLFRKGDLESLTNTLESVTTDESLRKSLTEAAYEWVSNNRTWRHSAMLVDQLYRKLV